MTVLVAALMLAQQPPAVAPPEPIRRMSDAERCTAARRVAIAASHPVPRMIDAVTRLDAVSVNCGRKTVATDHRVMADRWQMAAEWRARGQAQWNRTICGNDALRALAGRGWRFSRTVTFRSGGRVTQHAACQAGGDAGERALALQVATAFDLVCTGTISEVPRALSAPLIDRGRFHIVYRIDLEQRLYCTGECVSTQAIQSVTGSEIRFWSAGYRAALPRGVKSVDRDTGQYRDVLLSGTQALHSNGSCAPAPFTGFPARR